MSKRLDKPAELPEPEGQRCRACGCRHFVEEGGVVYGTAAEAVRAVQSGTSVGIPSGTGRLLCRHCGRPAPR